MDVIGFCGIGTMRMSLLFIGEVSLSSLHATSHLSSMQTSSVQLVTYISCILQHVNACNHPLCYHALHEKYNLSYMHHGHVSCYKSDFTSHNIELGSLFGSISFIVLGLNHNLSSYHSQKIRVQFVLRCLTTMKYSFYKLVINVSKIDSKFE